MSSERAPSTRLQSVDLLRGIVVVLMAIDHVRVYSGLPAGGSTAGIFFTRWVTHFCAPVFVFLAGTGAFFNGRAIGGPALRRYLLTRGALLVVLEMTLIRFFWSFSLDFSSFALAGIIWMLGWCMILLAPLTYLAPRTVAIVGVAVVLLQPVFGLPGGLLPATYGWIWNFVYPTGLESPGAINILYVIVPWIGVMAAGYGFGLVLTGDPEKRRRVLVWSGALMTAAFALLATVQAVASPPSDGTPLLFAILNQRKYPASPIFLLMTLGPAIALLPTFERAQGWLARAMIMFGRVPMFYYLLHIPLIHLSALVVWQLRGGGSPGAWYATAPYTQVPPDFRWSLGLLYAVYAVDIVVLYLACRWYEGVKRAKSSAWMRYV